MSQRLVACCGLVIAAEGIPDVLGTKSIPRLDGYLHIVVTYHMNRHDGTPLESEHRNPQSLRGIKLADHLQEVPEIDGFTRIGSTLLTPLRAVLHEPWDVRDRPLCPLH